MKFRKLKRILHKYGIVWDSRKGKGSHGVFVGPSHQTGLKQVYTVPGTQQKKVSKAYLTPLRRKFELTEEDGVSDALFRRCLVICATAVVAFARPAPGASQGPIAHDNRAKFNSDAESGSV